MKLYVKNKLISLAEGSNVYDENDESRYVVQGKALSITRKKTIKDLDGNTLYSVRNRLLKFIFGSAYIMDADANKLLKIRRRRLRKYTVESEDTDYTIDYGGLGKGYHVYRNGELVGVIKKKLGLIDMYEVTFDVDDDAPIMIAFAVAFDNIGDNKSNK